MNIVLLPRISKRVQRTINLRSFANFAWDVCSFEEFHAKSAKVAKKDKRISHDQITRCADSSGFGIYKKNW